MTEQEISFRFTRPTRRSPTQQTITRHLRTFAPPLPASSGGELHQAREQIFTALSRLTALFGTLILIVLLLPEHSNTPLYSYLLLPLVLGVIWVIALKRDALYVIRVTLFLLGIYAVAFIEMGVNGLTHDAVAIFMFFSMSSKLFLGSKPGFAGLTASTLSIVLVGTLISTGSYVPIAEPASGLTFRATIMTCLIFVMVVSSMQIGAKVLFERLEAALRSERYARALLQTERDMLEVQIEARTKQLAQAHAEALAAKQEALDQKTYLESLHVIGIELLQQRDVDQMLQLIVDRATQILDAPFGEVMLEDNGELIVHAFSANQPLLKGDRVGRDQALLSWQVFDTRKPVMIDDYTLWAQNRAIYAPLALRAVM